MSGRVDLYCERVGPDTLGEPANAITSFAYFVAASVASVQLRDDGRALPRILIGLVSLVGLCSFLLHTVARQWTLFLDAASTLAFVYFFNFVVLSDFLAVPRLYAALAALAYAVPAIVLSFAFPNRNPRLALVLAQIPWPLLMVVVGAVAFWLNKPRLASELIFGAALLCAGIALSWADDVVCPTFALGTHWVWHVLSAFVMWWMTTAIVPFSRRNLENSKSNDADAQT